MVDRAVLSLRWIAGLLALGSLAACDAGEIVEARDGGARRDASGDGGVVTPPSDGGATADGAVTGPADGGGALGDGGMMATGPSRPEECGNGVDDDEDGEIDDGCTCVVGTERPCYLGPEGTLNRGACRPGVQRCESAGVRAVWQACAGQVLPQPEIASNGIDDDCSGATDEPGARCLPTVNDESGTGCGNGGDDDCDGLVDCMDPGCAMATRCTSMRCPERTETVCFGGADEDCDGDFDCMDTDCRGTPSCMPSLCPSGQTPTYTERVLVAQSGPSSISAGDGQPVFTMTCAPGRCSQGQVAVVLAGRPAVCVPPPPTCPAGQSPAYRGSGWVCELPCELIIRYGYMFGFRRVCAQRPTITCGGGQVPTFDFSTERWVCRPTCSNTTYDRIILNGLLVCIPC